MKQLVMVGPRKSVIENVPDLRAQPGTILMKVKYTGLCMSEWHPWDEATAGMHMGHEPYGVVAEVGEGVTGFRVGERLTGMAITPTYAEYCRIPEKTALHVPDDLSGEDAVAEPLGCLVSVASKMPLAVPGDTVVVVGTGYMGLGMVSLFKMMGAGRIIAIDPREEARDNALKLGATETYAPDNLPDGFRFLDFLPGEAIFQPGFRIVQEFAGTQDALRLAGDLTAVNGRLGIGGWHQGGDRTLDIRQWGWKGFTAVNTHERDMNFLRDCAKRGMDMLVSGTWNFKGMSRHIYPMDAFDDANRDMISKPRGYIKALIQCDL